MDHLVCHSDCPCLVVPTLDLLCQASTLVGPRCPARCHGEQTGNGAPPGPKTKHRDDSTTACVPGYFPRSTATLSEATSICAAQPGAWQVAAPPRPLSIPLCSRQPCFRASPQPPSAFHGSPVLTSRTPLPPMDPPWDMLGPALSQCCDLCICISFLDQHTLPSRTSIELDTPPRSFLSFTCLRGAWAHSVPSLQSKTQVVPGPQHPDHPKEQRRLLKAGVAPDCTGSPSALS